MNDTDDSENEPLAPILPTPLSKVDRPYAYIERFQQQGLHSSINSLPQTNRRSTVKIFINHAFHDHFKTFKWRSQYQRQAHRFSSCLTFYTSAF